MSDAASAAATAVHDNPGASRFEITVGDELAGFAEYRLTDGGITFTHTVIDDAYGGRGLGGRLASAVLDEARARGLRVNPACSFIRGYIERHPDYLELVAS